MRNCIRWTGILSVVLLAASASRVPAAPLSELRTPCELSEFERHTSYEEMLTYLQQLRAASTDVRLGFFGESRQGRKLPYAILSRPSISQPWEAAVLERPVVVLAANVHGGERTLRESLLILMRKLAMPESEAGALLEHMVILAVPQLNPDGFHATSGGIRGNAWGIDLNRDYMKLEHPSIVGFVANVLTPWNPHVVIDAHDGGRFPYNVKYLGPSFAGCDPRITQLCDEGIFPHIDRRMEEHGYLSFYFSRGTEERLTIGGHEPRIGRNYLGLRNSIGILFESPGRQSLETGVKSGIVAFEAVLEFVRDHADDVMDCVRQARLETLHKGQNAEGEVVVAMRYEAADEPVTYQIEVGEDDERELRTITDAPIMKKPVPTAVRARPYAYLLPRDAEAAVALLRRHNITVEVLQDEVELDVEAYPLLDIRYVQAYNHLAAVRVEAGDPVTVSQAFPAGTYVVPTAQMAGRVAAHLLEPETTDSLVFWNTMDAWLPKKALADAQSPEDDDDEEQDPVLLPIYKIMQPTALPSILAE